MRTFFYVVVGLALMLVIIMIIVAIIRKMRECKHRFKEDEVRDINQDPKCVKCGMYFNRIVSTGKKRFHFEYMEKEKLYSLSTKRR